MTIKKVDHVVTGSSLIISQYKEKPRISSLLSSLLAPIQSLEEILVQADDILFNLDQATGDRLNICGKILNQPRNSLPDYIYRRILKTKVKVIGSQGRVEELIDIIHTLQDLSRGDNSAIYSVLPDTIDPSGGNSREGREIEISIIPVQDNLIQDPKPFEPRLMHDLLLQAKGSGEKLQTIYPIVGLNKNPSEDSLRFIHNPSGGQPSTSSNGLGSIYPIYLGDYAKFGGTIGHRREGVSVSNIRPLENLVSPSLSLSSTWIISGGLSLSTGSWLGLPEYIEYDLYRNGLPVTNLTGTTKENIESYSFTQSDLSASWYVLERAVRSEAIDGLIGTNILYGPGYVNQFPSPNLLGWWNFSNITEDANHFQLDNLVSTSTLVLSSANPSFPTIGFFNGHPVGIFDGTKELIGTTSSIGYGMPLTPPYHVMMVISQSIDGTDDNIFGGQLGSEQVSVKSVNSPNEGYEIQASNVATVFSSLSGPKAFWITFNDVGFSFAWMNNDFRDFMKAPLNIGSSNFEFGCIGGLANFSTNPPTVNSDRYNGSIFEIAIFTGSIDDPNLKAQWASYLNNKWGLTISSSS